MIILINRGIWHRDCPDNKYKSGVIQELDYDKQRERSLVKCLHCGQKGYIPKGTPFKVEVCIDNEPKEQNNEKQ